MGQTSTQQLMIALGQCGSTNPAKSSRPNCIQAVGDGEGVKDWIGEV